MQPCANNNNNNNNNNCYLQDLHEQQYQLIVLSFQTILGILVQSSWNHSWHILHCTILPSSGCLHLQNTSTSICRRVLLGFFDSPGKGVTTPFVRQLI